jgi:hypothetical protein
MAKAKSTKTTKPKAAAGKTKSLRSKSDLVVKVGIL